MSTQAIRRFSLVFLALVALAGPARAHDDYDSGRQVPEAGMRYILRTLDRAAYEPAVLDVRFFETLSAYAPGSDARIAFRDALRDIRWYRNPIARGWVQSNNSRFYGRYIRNNGVRVFVEVISDDPALAETVREGAFAYLPEYAQGTRYREDADVVIRLRARISEPRFATVKRKQDRKKYKKAYRKNPVVQNRLFYGYYNQTKEKVSLRVDYRVRVVAGYETIGSYSNTLRLSDSFKYITDFRAQGARGWVADAPYPSKKVARRASRDVEAVRYKTADALMARAAYALTKAVAEAEIPLRSELYPKERRYSQRGR